MKIHAIAFDNGNNYSNIGNKELHIELKKKNFNLMESISYAAHRIFGEYACVKPFVFSQEQHKISGEVFRYMNEGNCVSLGNIAIKIDY